MNSRRIGIGSVVLVAVSFSAWYYASTQPDPLNIPQPASAAAVTGIAAAGLVAVSNHVAKPAMEPVTTVSPPTSPVQSSVVTEAQKQPSIDLVTAIKLAQANSATAPAPMPPGITSWQGLTQEQAAKVFEAAVREHSRDMTANPFRAEVTKH